MARGLFDKFTGEAGAKPDADEMATIRAEMAAMRKRADVQRRWNVSSEEHIAFYTKVLEDEERQAAHRIHAQAEAKAAEIRVAKEKTHIRENMSAEHPELFYYLNGKRTEMPKDGYLKCECGQPLTNLSAYLVDYLYMHEHGEEYSDKDIGCIVFRQAAPMSCSCGKPTFVSLIRMP